MDALPWVFSSGWASGINSYAVVLVLGLAGRFLGADDVPAALTRTDVLVAAAVLFCLDAVADKVPYLDSVWDAVHTAVRPTIGAALGALLAGDAATPEQALLAVTGGTSALISHLVKAGLRVLVNISPEPASNIAVSTAEDVTVAGVVSVSLIAPWLAAGVALGFLVVGLTVVLLLLGRIRHHRRSRRQHHPDRHPDSHPDRHPDSHPDVRPDRPAGTAAADSGDRPGPDRADRTPGS